MKLKGMNDWGIIITQKQVNQGFNGMNPLELAFVLEEADFDRIAVDSGVCYFSETNRHKEVSDTNVWFWKIRQPNFFKPPYKNVAEIECEFLEHYPELAKLLPLAPRFCRLNAVYKEV